MTLWGVEGVGGGAVVQGQPAKWEFLLSASSTSLSGSIIEIGSVPLLNVVTYESWASFIFSMNKTVSSEKVWSIHSHYLD